MAQANTPLINELLKQVGQHPDFEAWRHKGKLPAGIVKQLCQPLRADPRFIGQPGRFYMSAIAVVDYIYKAWLALQKRLQYQLEGKTRWLEMLKSDAELVEVTGCTLDTIRIKAAEILAQQTTLASDLAPAPKTKAKKGKKRKISNVNRNLSQALFEAYPQTEDILTRACICYLLKNGCKVSSKEEDPEKFNLRRRKIEIRVKRLTEQLASRMPKGRDLTSERWLETLAIATSHVPQDENEAKSWQASLLRESSSVPFPVAFETNEDLRWSKNPKGRLCVEFNGLSEHTFEVYCDKRQLHWFQRFLEDSLIKRDSKNQHSSSLFTLRSGRIAWQEGEGKGDPWNVHRLTLYCSVDTRLWTHEGTEQVRNEKAAEIAKTLTTMKEKGDLNEKQQAFIKRKSSTLTRIKNPFPRPNKPLYQGQSNILVGVSLGLEKPATAAVVDAITGKVLAYRSIRQLLGENYKLLNRQRQEQHHNSSKRHNAQRQGAPNQFGESNLGEYVDRLLAKAIIALAKTYYAGSIVLPKLADVRESIQSEVQARAEQKCPELIEAQKNYAKQYRSSVHSWSYSRLIESIQSQAAQAGISVEEARQSLVGSPQDKAEKLAIDVYNFRLQAII
jgi:IS605 OrfB family transposase